VPVYSKWTTIGAVRVELYGKADCGLCDEAKEILDRVRGRIPFELEVRDVASDPELALRYGAEVPVVFIDGRKAFKYVVDEAELERKLRR
jgi:glutaredoxin